MNLSRTIAFVILSVALVATNGSASLAQPTPDVPPPSDEDGPEVDGRTGSDGKGGEAEGTETTTVGGTPGRPGTPDYEALWERFCGYTSNNAAGGDYTYSDGATVQVIWVEQTDVDAQLSNYRINCIRADGSAYDGGIFNLPDGSGVGAVDPTILRARAFARIDIEPPGIETNPSFTDRFAVVRIPTWLWVTDSWDDRVESDSDGGLTVEVTAGPTGILWEFTEPVDENFVNCEDEPVPWTPGADDSTSNCKYTFVSSSAGIGSGDAFEGLATISWEFSWSLNGVDQGTFANIDGITPFEIQVGEIQAVGTPNA